MFFADPVAAFRHLRTQLVPGARFDLAVWGPPRDNVWMMAVMGVIRAHVEVPPATPRAPGPFAFEDIDYLRDLLADAGFARVDIDDWRGDQAIGGPGRTALSFAPTYSMYPEYARNTHTRWVAGRRRDDFGIDVDAAVALIDAEQPDVVFLTSPNNPTGTALDPAHTRAVLDAAPGMVVVDEAYAEFRRAGTPSALELLADHGRLIVTRTMSKAFALAGGRLGYLAAHADVVDALRIVRLPYHLSSVTQATALAALRHTDELLANVDALRVERDRTAERLRGLGLTVADSDANFVLFGTFEDRHATWQALVDRGVLIRETGPLGWLRVSIGTPSEMDAFFTALQEVIA